MGHFYKLWVFTHSGYELEHKESIFLDESSCSESTYLMLLKMGVSVQPEHLLILKIEVLGSRKTRCSYEVNTRAAGRISSAAAAPSAAKDRS
jgi:hypothetical protein